MIPFEVKGPAFACGGRGCANTLYDGDTAYMTGKAVVCEECAQKSKPS